MDPGVEVLTLDRDSFTRLIGHLDSFNRDYIDRTPQIPMYDVIIFITYSHSAQIPANC